MSNLFDPITLRDLTIKNRVWVSPMCQYSAIDGVVGDWHMAHLGAFATGEAGLVMAEATGVVPEGRISIACPGIYNDEQIAAFKTINDNFNKGPDKRWDNNVLQGMNIGYLTTSALLGAGKDLTRPGIISYIEANAAKLSSAALSPLGYSAKTHEAYTGFWIGKYDATAVLKPIDATRKVWTTDSAKGAVSELKYTRPAIAADALPKVG